jgi:FkbM family methyltransferase
MQYFKQISNPEFPKIFLDVGCNHPVRHNNSYFFEKYMGFKVIGVDALEKYENEWKTIRPNADLVVTAVGDRDGTLEFEETEHDGYEGDMYSAVKGYSNKAEKLKRVGRIVPVKTLTNILKSRNIIDIGIMSLDIEGYELSALQGIDTNSIRIQIVILENNSNNLLGNEKVRKFMRSKGYVLKARIWGLDDVYEHKCLNRQPQRD